MIHAELLKALHLLTRDGKLNQDARRKLKQVTHFLGFLKPWVEDCRTNEQSIHAVDFGAGKSYLGLILADQLLRNSIRPQLTAVESRPELVEKIRTIAEFIPEVTIHAVADVIKNFSDPHDRPDSQQLLVLALHACDTATDDALIWAIQNRAKHIAVVPCCQAQVARSLKPLGGLKAIIEAPIHQREFGSHLTNVIRALVLRHVGYRVTVTELVGWEHSLKNELILAQYTGKSDLTAMPKIEALRKEFAFDHALIDGLAGWLNRS